MLFRLGQARYHFHWLPVDFAVQVNVICASISCKEPSLWRILLRESAPLPLSALPLGSVFPSRFADMSACCVFQGEQGYAHTHLCTLKLWICLMSCGLPSHLS